MDAALSGKTIAILGTGLLGASIGLALRQRGHRGTILGVGRRRKTLDEAQALGAIDEGLLEVAPAVARADLAILAVPLSGFEALFAAVAAAEHEGLILTDVGSTKASVLAQAQAHLRYPERFVGAHPMAGSEKQGPEAAQADLFVGKPCILTPQTNTDPGALALVESFWAALGMKLLRMDAAEHDRQTALTSHLPHTAAVMLMHVAMARGGWDVASTGFTSTTRLASSNPPMRADIMMANRAALLEALDAMDLQMVSLRGLLQAGDEAALVQWLEQARDRRDQWLADAPGA